MTKQLHTLEKEQCRALLEQEDIDRREDRLDILESFLQTEHHVTCQDMVHLLEAQEKTYSPEFVQDTMRLLYRLGFARKNRFNNGHVRYEHMHIGEHHDHLICTGCGAIVEFENDQIEALQRQIADAYGFEPLHHRMELYGICSNCRKDRTEGRILAFAKPGEKLTITDVVGGPGARLRLRTMGLKIGDLIEVISNINKGQMAIAVGNTRYAIGRGLAQKILVKAECVRPVKGLS